MFHAKWEVKLNVATWQLQSSKIAMFVGSDCLQPLEICKLIKCAELLKSFSTLHGIQLMLTRNMCTGL